MQGLSWSQTERINSPVCSACTLRSPTASHQMPSATSACGCSTRLKPPNSPSPKPRTGYSSTVKPEWDEERDELRVRVVDAELTEPYAVRWPMAWPESPG